MLILARQRVEQIVIGDDVTITVVDIRGDKVRLGIEAPRSVNVDRWEVRRAKDAGVMVRSGPKII